MSGIVGEEMVITPLGGGQEVGRSCILLQYQNRNILLDCGCHPGREGIDSLPFFDAIENTENIDLILITHFHIDHCAALPYFTEKTSFSGKIYMTHATKAVMRLLLSDNIRLQSKGSVLYSEQDLQNCIDKIDVIDYYQTKEWKGIKFTPTPAGHVLGAAMFTIEIDNIRILYTGDYSLEEDRHLPQAEVPGGGPPDVLIVESTFGTTSVPPRAKREIDFTSAVESIVLRGGSCLIPVFALGRAQELLLILDEYWKEHPRLQNIPIYYASKLATKSLRVYQTFVNMMNDHVRHLSNQFINPFKLQHIRSIQNLDNDVFSPSVVMASPGFLQSGISRQLFEHWCDDERHGVIIAGYTIEGTLASELLSMPTEIKCQDNRIKPRKCSIDTITFSAHVDYQQNQSFIKSVTPDYIVLVHGEKTQMKRLKEALESEMRKNLWPTEHQPKIAMPENGVHVKLRFRKNILANVVGRASVEMLRSIEEGRDAAASNVSVPARTLVVTENFRSQVVSTAELSQFTNCKFGKILEKFVVPIPQDILTFLLSSVAANPALAHRDVDGMLLQLVQSQLAPVFRSAEYDENNQSLLVEHLVLVSCVYPPSSFLKENPIFAQARSLATGLEISWTASALADVVADSIAGLLLHFFSATNMIRLNLERLPRSSAVKTEAPATLGPSLDHRRIAELMHRGQIDPSQKIVLTGMTVPDQSEQLRQLKEKLERSIYGEQFSLVSLTQTRDKLVLRGQPGTRYRLDQATQQLVATAQPSAAATEAFVFVLFDGKQDDHSPPVHLAVVASEDEDFQRAVSFIFRQLA